MTPDPDRDARFTSSVYAMLVLTDPERAARAVPEFPGGAEECALGAFLAVTFAQVLREEMAQWVEEDFTLLQEAGQLFTPAALVTEAQACFTELLCTPQACQSPDPATRERAAHCVELLYALTGLIAYPPLDLLVRFHLERGCTRLPSAAPPAAAPAPGEEEWRSFPFGFFGDLYWRNTRTGEEISNAQALARGISTRLR